MTMPTRLEMCARQVCGIVADRYLPYTSVKEPWPETEKRVREAIQAWWEEEFEARKEQPK